MAQVSVRVGFDNADQVRPWIVVLNGRIIGRYRRKNDAWLHRNSIANGGI